MATKVLTDKEWVGLAADSKHFLPALEGVCFKSEAMVAMNFYRMHFVDGAHGLQQGLFHVKTGAPIDGKFPDWRQVVPVATAATTLPYLDVNDAKPILKAALAAYRAAGRTFYWVTLPTCDGKSVALNPEYVLDALAGCARSLRSVPFQAPDPLKPVLFQVLGVLRQAVIVPVRMTTGFKSPRFDLTEFVKAHDGGAYPFPAYSGESK
jgi:hypothetical protein